MSSAGVLVVEDDGATERANYARAILNILDDFGEERSRQGDNQRAVINILDDMETERLRLEHTQKAMLNILDDFDLERIRVERANADLQTVNEAMKGFTAVAAHDLRSPLTSIVGFATILTENWETLSEQDRRKFASTIDRQAHNLSNLVDDLLTVSIIEGGAVTMQPELIDLAEAITHYLEAGGTRTADVSVSCSTDLAVWVDAQHLGRILDNYVQNALKYGKPPVRIEAVRVADMVEVRVLDHGPGVPPEFVAQLFGKFARADTAGTRANKGTGLGLSIVRGLAEANGGHARYEPNSPHGSSFIFRLRAAEGPRR